MRGQHGLGCGQAKGGPYGAVNWVVCRLRNIFVGTLRVVATCEKDRGLRGCASATYSAVQQCNCRAHNTLHCAACTDSVGRKVVGDVTGGIGEHFRSAAGLVNALSRGTRGTVAIAFAYVLAARKRAATPPRVGANGSGAGIWNLLRHAKHWIGRRRRLKPSTPSYIALVATAVLLCIGLVVSILYRPPSALVTTLAHDPVRLPAELTAASGGVRNFASASGGRLQVLNLTSTQRQLAQNYLVPNAVAAAVHGDAATRLLQKLDFATRIHRKPARLMVIHVQNGLGNRLRALSSGLAMARGGRRVPLVVWEADAHLGAKFGDILEQRAPHSASKQDPNTILYSDLVVIDAFPAWAHVSGRTDNWRPFNYMVKDGPLAQQGERLFWLSSTVPCAPKWYPRLFTCTQVSDTIRNEQHVYFKSAYVAEVFPRHLSYSSRVNAEMRALRPNKQVLDIVNHHWPRVTPIFGAHVRSRLVSRDGVAVDDRCEYSASAEEMTDYWRAQSSFQEFVNLLHYLMRRYRQLHFFVAADDAQALKNASSLFPGRIHYIPRTCDDRTPECVRYALADLLALARCGRIYGSNWSSFTEAAGRLANKRPWLSGLHFGKMRGRHHRTYTWRRALHTLQARLARRGANCEDKT